MDFFQSQDIARRQTGRLVLLFVLAVLGIILATYLIVAGVLLGTGGAGGADSLWNPGLMAAVGGITVLLVGGGSLWKLHQLRGGGRVIAEQLGGRLLTGAVVSGAGADLGSQRLLNVVDEMAIASGIPAPAVYVLEDEAGINAFAAGFSPEDAVIGVTRGCVTQLNREQLQGVIAHEFSHLLNGDMRLNLRLVGAVHGILLLALVGRAVLRSLRFSGGRMGGGGVRVGGGRRSGKGGGGIAAVFLIALGLMVVGFVGVFFGNLIKAAVSRQREFLADASSVQFTRNPDGIAGALKIIGGTQAGSSLRAVHAAEASHMFFAKGLRSGFESFFATHPPLPERIRRIQPSWDGEFPEPTNLAVEKDSADGVEDVPPGASALAGVAGGEGPSAGAAGAGAARGAGGVAAATAAGLRRAVASDRTVSADDELLIARGVSLAGRPTPEHVAFAERLLSRMPAELLSAAREPWSARAVIFALLVQREPLPRERQMQRLEQLVDGALSTLTRQVLPAVEALPQAARLPLIDLAIPALRALSRPQYDEFIRVLDDLFAADDTLDLFEWSLQRILRRHLAPAFEPAAQHRPRHAPLARLGEPVAVLLSALASAGVTEAGGEAGPGRDAERAFARAVALTGHAGSALLPPDQCAPGALDASLNVLADTLPEDKRVLLAACVACVTADGRVQIAEAELLRAFADGLGCPLPPLLPESSRRE